MAARTLTQLSQAVQDYGYGTDLSSQITGFLNEEYRNIAGERRWEWLQAENASIQINPGFFGVTLTINDIRNIEAVFAMDTSGVAYPLRYMSPIKLRERVVRDAAQSAYGTPRYWSVWAGQINLWPAGDQQYNLDILYVKNITALVSGSDFPLIPEAYDDALVWGAVGRLAIRKHDWITHQFAMNQRDAVRAEMRADYELKQRQTADEVERTGIWDHGVDAGPQYGSGTYWSW